MTRPHRETLQEASTTALVESLGRVTRRFSLTSRLLKLRILAVLRDRPIRRGTLLRRFYDALCFLRAYPDDETLLRDVEKALNEFTRRVEALQAGGRRRGFEALDDSGAAGVSVYCTFSYPIARWLAERFPEAVEIDWDDPAIEDGMGSVLPFLTEPAAEDALVEVDTSYRRWLAAAKGNHMGSDLQWLLYRLGQAVPDAQMLSAYYDRLRLSIRWEVRNSKTLHAPSTVYGAPTFFQKGPLVRGRALPPLRLPGMPVPVRGVGPREATELIDVARAALSMRHRETHAFNFANPEDSLVADLGRGVRIAWFGVLPEHRLPLRAHFGFLILKNAIPVGYGDASLLFDWMDGGGGMNIFEMFRHGESAFIFSRLVAFFYQHLGVRAFHLSRWDLGYGNPEGIQSGSFWFYYRFGFRSKSEDLQRIATLEQHLIGHRRGYRSPPEILEKLCQVGMFASFGEHLDPTVRDFETRRVGQKASALLGQADPGEVVSTVAASLGVGQWRAWSRPERVAFERLAPILALISDLPRWPAREREALVKAIRAKAGPSEAEYLRRLRSLPRLRASLLALGASSPVEAAPRLANSVAPAD